MKTQHVATSPSRTPAREWRPAYLAALAETGTKAAAAQAAGVDRVTAWRAERDEPEFAAAVAESLHAGALLLEQEAVRRARDGSRRYLYTKAGAPVMDPRTGEQAFELVYSDALLKMVLEGEFPNKYRRRLSVETSGGKDAPALTLEDRRRLVLELLPSLPDYARLVAARPVLDVEASAT